MQTTEKMQMLREIEQEVAYTRSVTGRQSLDDRVMAAMKAVPRHQFVPVGARAQAYYNGPLPIGHGQTISQPYIVALMTDLLETTADDVVLEVGTGSGYQAAVLSRLVRQVYSLEIVQALSERAADVLARLGYGNVECRAGDGYHGWPEHAPFDGILVTAATPVIPPPLVAQLKPGGRLVVPVGQPYSSQELMVLEKLAGGKTTVRDILAVVFVPLTGEVERR